VADVVQKGAVMSEKKKRLVAYHEAGHALVGALMPEYDPVTKISIVPRGAAGGLTFFAPSEERLESGLYSRTVCFPAPAENSSHVCFSMLYFVVCILLVVIVTR
jgi:ATP-dependent Zn protease